MARLLAIAPAIRSLTSLSLSEQDLLLVLHHLRTSGHDVHLLTSRPPDQVEGDVDEFYESQGISVTLVTNHRKRLGPRQWNNVTQTGENGLSSDSVSHYLRAVELLMNDWPPDAVWCHGSSLWMATERARRRRIPTILRSIGSTEDRPINQRALRAATVFVAAGPSELKSAGAIHLLPLLSLTHLLRPSRPPFPARPLRVAYILTGDNNADSLRMLSEVIAPSVRSAAPGGFVFHVQGDPPPALATVPGDIVYHTDKPELESFLADMDIAIVPSAASLNVEAQALAMLCRAAPTITQRRTLGGYPFVDGVNVVIVSSDNDYPQKLLALRDPLLRARLSMGAASQAARLFGEAQVAGRMDAIMSAALK